MNLDGGWNQKVWKWTGKPLEDIVAQTKIVAANVLKCSEFHKFDANILNENSCYQNLSVKVAEPFFLKKSLMFSKLDPILKIFGSEKVHLVDGENLVINPAEEYGRIQEIVKTKCCSFKFRMISTNRPRPRECSTFAESRKFPPSRSISRYFNNCPLDFLKAR